MSKKGWLLGLYVLALALMTGCGGEAQDGNADTPDSSVSGEETPETGGEDEETQGEESSEEPVEVTGTIKSFTGGYLSILDEEQKTLGFDLGNASIECSNGILAGDQVAVTYQGELDVFGTGGAELLRIGDPAEKQELPEETVTGLPVSVTPNTLTIQQDTENKEDIITFFTVGTKFRCKKGIGEDDLLSVTYKGAIQGGNARNVKVLSVKDAGEKDAGEKAAGDGEAAKDPASAEAAVTEEPAGEDVLAEGAAVETPTPAPDKEDIHKMTGVISEVKGTVLTVVQEEGDAAGTYQFDLTDGNIALKYGLLEGSQVKVKYSGELVKGDVMPLLSLRCTKPGAVNEDLGGFTVTGTVMAIGQNNMTITSDDGAQITFTTEETSFETTNPPREGSYVKGVIRPSSKSNVYQALRISDAF